jgi:hypothetical protein
VALAATHGPYRHESSGASPWSPGSSATSVASFPTRGWTSPGASVTSRYPVAPPGMMAQHSRNTPPGTGPNPQRPQLCYVFYQHGHWLTDCPALSPEARREAAMNRERYLSGVQHRDDAAPRPPSLEARESHVPPQRYGAQRDGRRYPAAEIGTHLLETDLPGHAEGGAELTSEEQPELGPDDRAVAENETGGI